MSRVRWVIGGIGGRYVLSQVPEGVVGPAPCTPEVAGGANGLQGRRGWGALLQGKDKVLECTGDLSQKHAPSLEQAHSL